MAEKQRYKIQIWVPNIASKKHKIKAIKIINLQISVQKSFIIKKKNAMILVNLNKGYEFTLIFNLAIACHNRDPNSNFTAP